jgi:hypothetical protein
LATISLYSECKELTSCSQYCSYSVTCAPAISVVVRPSMFASGPPPTHWRWPDYAPLITDTRGNHLVFLFPTAVFHLRAATTAIHNALRSHPRMNHTRTPHHLIMTLRLQSANVCLGTRILLI